MPAKVDVQAVDADGGKPRRRGKAWQPRVKIWVEHGDEIALSDWRVELLLAIDRTGSLTRAAQELAVPYRTAWYKLKEIEDRLGVKLLDTRSGGATGGGSHLTAEGRELVDRFQRLSAGVAALVEARFREEFRDLLA